jgi:hypothetical protein
MYSVQRVTMRQKQRIVVCLQAWQSKGRSQARGDNKGADPTGSRFLKRHLVPCRTCVYCCLVHAHQTKPLQGPCCHRGLANVGLRGHIKQQYMQKGQGTICRFRNLLFCHSGSRMPAAAGSCWGCAQTLPSTRTSACAVAAQLTKYGPAAGAGAGSSAWCDRHCTKQVPAQPCVQLCIYPTHIAWHA